eukprot:m.9532 g.9532  ORF g.9532 m.9532 type:complete len:361 (-) comp5463_c0_seq1:204-1286(-)
MAMYDASQIKIPADLPEILKRYTKAAIKTQPTDLLLWSAQYFEALSSDQSAPVQSRVAASATPTEYTEPLSMEQLSKLYAQFKLCGTTVSRAELDEMAKTVGMPQQSVQDAVAVGEFGDAIPWVQVLTLICASFKQGPSEALSVFGQVVSDEAGMVPNTLFAQALAYVVTLDDDVSQDVQQGVLAAIGSEDVQASAILSLVDHAIAESSDSGDGEGTADPDLSIEGKAVDAETARGGDDQGLSVLGVEDETESETEQEADPAADSSDETAAKEQSEETAAIETVVESEGDKSEEAAEGGSEDVTEADPSPADTDGQADTPEQATESADADADADADAAKQTEDSAEVEIATDVAEPTEEA